MRHPSLTRVVAVLFAVIGEAGLVALLASHLAPLPLLVMLHGGIAIAVIFLLLGRPGKDARVVPVLIESENDPRFLFNSASSGKTATHFSRKRSNDAVDPAIALIILVAGPAGAFVSLLMLPLFAQKPQPQTVLEAWYDRLANAGRKDLSRELTDRFGANRGLLDDAGAAVSFAEVLAAGSLAQKQTVLGLIARKFDPDFAPALLLALRSDEPVIRVQAAAVVARVREDLKQRTEELLGHAGGFETADLQRAGELTRIAECPLTSAANKVRCHTRAQSLLENALHSSEAFVLAGKVRGESAAAAIDTYLIANARFADFRVMRRVRAIAARPHYRVRRRQPLKEAA